MSSFIGAAAPGGQFALLARSVSVTLTTTAAQAICTPSQAYVPLYFVLRTGATAWSSTGSFAVGTTGALSALVSTKVATSLATTVPLVMTLFTSGSTTVEPVLQAAGTVVYFNMVQIEPTATASAVDLIGYLI